MEDLVLNPLGPSSECIVLYVEDDDVTAYLFQHALTQTGTHLHLFRVSNGEEALSFLFRQGPYREAPLPDLVILDVNMPKKTGFDVLEGIRSNEELRGLLVVMVTSSTSSEDRQEACDLGVSEYHIKGSDWKEFLTASKSICELVSQLADAKHRAADQGGKHVDYCLNILGIRVRDKNCCLIAKLGNAWSPLGPIRNLPVSIPSTPLELQIAGNDPLALTAWQYEQEHPSTDLRDVLSQGKAFP